MLIGGKRSTGIRTRVTVPTMVTTRQATIMKNGYLIEKPDISFPSRFRGVCGDVFRLNLLSVTELAAVADDHAILVRQAGEHFDANAVFESELHGAFFDDVLGVDGETLGAVTRN